MVMNLEHITSENINNQYDLKSILKNSVFYPASGLDGTPIEAFSSYTNSFVYVDYSFKKRNILNALKNDFKEIGYQLIGIKEINHEDLTPEELKDYKYDYNEHEIDRFSEKTLKKRYNDAVKNSYGFWAVYELQENASNSQKKNKRMSILHIYGEAIHFFIKSYGFYSINPLAIALIYPGEGYGDNWTIFRSTEYKLYKTLLSNKNIHKQKMPQFILELCSDNKCCFGDEYSFLSYFYSYSHNKNISLFKYNPKK